MGIYIFSWKVLKEALETLKDEPGCDFGKHIIPYCHNKGERLFAYEYNGYVGDQYNDILNDNKEYYCMDMSDAPTFSFDVSGKGENITVNKKALISNGCITEKSSNRGFDINKSKLMSYMNSNNINKINIEIPGRYHM